MFDLYHYSTGYQTRSDYSLHKIIYLWLWYGNVNVDAFLTFSTYVNILFAPWESLKFTTKYQEISRSRNIVYFPLLYKFSLLFSCRLSIPNLSINVKLLWKLQFIEMSKILTNKKIKYQIHISETIVIVTVAGFCKKLGIWIFNSSNTFFNMILFQILEILIRRRRD